MIYDLRYALRLIAAHPWYSTAIVATLAFGIGINAMVFTMVNAILFKPVPLPNGDRLVTICSVNLQRNNRNLRVSYPDFQSLREQNSTLEALEAATRDRGVISENDNPPDRFRMSRVSPTLFRSLQIPPIIGRDFTVDDGQPGADSVLIIGYGLWSKRYAADPKVIGRIVRVNGKPATIIGVMPEGFKFPSNQDFWTPLVPDAQLKERSRRPRPLELFGILKKDTNIEKARTDMSVIAGQIAREYPDTNKNIGATVLTFHNRYNDEEIRAIFLFMLGAVGFVLLIACSNVANMMLSKAIGRRYEISIRAAMGASRWRIIRQLLIESVTLSVFGGLLGLGISLYGIHLFDMAVSDVGKPFWIQFDMDYLAFGYFAAISILSGILFGLAPAINASRSDLNSTLKDNARTSGSASKGRLTGTLVVLQFSMTVTLLANAGLMVRSILSVQSSNEFVPSDEIIVAGINLPSKKGERYSEKGDRIQFYNELVRRVKSIPGVSYAAATSDLPGLGAERRRIEIEGKPILDKEDAEEAFTISQTSDYLSAISLPILRGRDFMDTDGQQGEPVAIVNRQFAEKYWPEESSIGKRFRYLEKSGPSEWKRVIGVSAGFLQSPRRTTPLPLVFNPNSQEGRTDMMLLLRTSGDPHSLTRPLKTIVQELDQNLPVSRVRTMREFKNREFWFLSVFGSLFMTFALVALIMASVGIYAVVAQATGNRKKEIGVRMALGATSEMILKLVVSRGVKQLIIGLAFGLAIAFATTRHMEQDLLFATSSHDPIVFVSVIILLAGVGMFACWLPARKATLVDPNETLRAE